MGLTAPLLTVAASIATFATLTPQWSRDGAHLRLLALVRREPLGDGSALVAFGWYATLLAGLVLVVSAVWTLGVLAASRAAVDRQSDEAVGSEPAG